MAQSRKSARKSNLEDQNSPARLAAAKKYLPPGANITPMLKQWLDAKLAAPDAVLFFRMGDFYELFGTDATDVGELLSLSVTSRDKNKGDKAVAMAGFPHHAAGPYIKKLVEHGYQVAMCDQLEDPALAQGIVERGITHLISPGTLTDLENLNSFERNHLAALISLEGHCALCWLECSTGDIHVTLVANSNEGLDWLLRLSPREVLMSEQLKKTVENYNTIVCAQGGQPARTASSAQAAVFKKKYAALMPDLPPRLLKGQLRAIRHAVATALYYVDETIQMSLEHLKPIIYVDDLESMSLDHRAIEHLSVRGPSHNIWRHDTLAAALNTTQTALGARRLLEILMRPLLQIDAIAARHEMIQVAMDGGATSEAVRRRLGSVYDIERLVTRLMLGRARPKDIQWLARSADACADISNMLVDIDHPLAEPLQMVVRRLSVITAGVSDAFVDAVQNDSVRMIFAHGFDAEVDRLAGIREATDSALARLEAEEIERTGISSLKIKFNRVFGYFLEVRKSALDKVPSDYVRKQTIANGERYTYVKLSNLEQQIEAAGQELELREKTLFHELCQKFKEQAHDFQTMAGLIADVDVFFAHADLSLRKGYVQPVIRPAADKSLVIEQGRHPMVENALEQNGETYVPSSVRLNPEERTIQLITGPNMAGKSTVMRMVGLVQLMAQAGLYVPAGSAELSLVDHIFSRVGASDDVVGGRSTFMVEMTEAAHILAHATEHSLFLIDELGRGTSTYDGLALAAAILEELATRVGARGLFATHYHELTEISERYPGVVNTHVPVEVLPSGLVFSRQLVDGVAGRSYGVHVAEMAGVAERVTRRAEDFLEQFEHASTHGGTHTSKKRSETAYLQHRPHPFEHVVEVVLQFDPNQHTPIETVMFLQSLQKEITELKSRKSSGHVEHIEESQH